MGLISNGTTVFDNGSMASGFGGNMTFIKKLTASGSATLSFVDGSDGVVLDNTYKEYVFTFKDIHPATDGADFEFNMSTDGGSNYNVAKTTTLFDPIHGEDGSSGGIAYSGSRDLAQGTGGQDLMGSLGADNDQSGSGYLHLFNPSSTTFVKHFLSRTHYSHSGNYALSMFIAGYGNTTSAVDAIRFQMSSGNIDAGDICLYGIA
jgi:hypothetical protein